MTYRQFRRLIIWPSTAVGLTALILFVIYAGEHTRATALLVIAGFNFVVLGLDFVARGRLPR